MRGACPHRSPSLCGGEEGTKKEEGRACSLPSLSHTAYTQARHIYPSHTALTRHKDKQGLASHGRRGRCGSTKPCCSCLPPSLLLIIIVLMHPSSLPYPTPTTNRNHG